MGINTEVPLNLYKANLELQLRLTRLVQETQKNWLELGTQGTVKSIAETNSQLEQVLKTQDWQKLAALPADTFWRQLQSRFNDNQALVQIAVSSQTSFSAGLQDALQTWQKETLQAVSGITDVSALNGTLKDLVSQWSKYWPANAGETKTSKSATGTKE